MNLLDVLFERQGSYCLVENNIHYFENFIKNDLILKLNNYEYDFEITIELILNWSHLMHFYDSLNIHLYYLNSDRILFIYSNNCGLKGEIVNQYYNSNILKPFFIPGKSSEKLQIRLDNVKEITDLELLTILIQQI